MSASFCVLIIDDSKKDTLLIASELRKQWPTLAFERVDNATAMREALNEQTWDCIVCDVVMPAFSALAALEIVRQSELFLPFIAISGTIKVEDAVKLLKIGAHDFVQKDDLARLVPAMKSAIREVENLRMQKQSEEELRQFEHIVSSTSDMLALLDQHYVYLAVNEAYLRAFAKSSAELIGQTVTEVFGEEFFNTVIKPNAEVCLAGKDVRYQGWVEFPATGRKYMDIICSPYRGPDSEVLGFVVTARDFTLFKQAEVALKSLTQRMRTSIEEMPIAYILWDEKLQVTEWNPSAERVFGYSRSEMLGKNAVDYIVPGPVRSLVNQVLTKLLVGESDSYSETGNNITKDGTVISCHWYNSPLKDDTGSTAAILSMALDVTEREQLTEELDQHRHQLEQLVEERTAQLAEARQRAEAANRAKSAFLANMSHEIRTPMNAIVGLTHLMQQAGPTPEQADRLHKIEASTQHLLSIINDILDISKIEAEKLTLEQSDFHLDAIFDHVLSLFKEQINSRGLAIETDRNEISDWLRGDLTRLRQALLNYVGNAIKFTEKGTILLRAIKLEEDDNGILLRFEVQDTGIGIEPDKLAGLFEAFEQADASTTRTHGGTGLGLVITRRLAQLMGGEAGAESEPGKGSTFWFTARLGRGHEVMPSAPSQKVERVESGLLPHHQGSRILLAEDNAINLEVAVGLLSGAGLVVDTAENGREAVEMVRTNAYDLILMDVQMPEMDGLEATRLIRSMASSEATVGNIPILAMTANVFAEDRQACLSAGMNDFVAKPIDLNNLFSTLAKWLPGPESISLNPAIEKEQDDV
ncbi:MAG: response regulator [Gammaproteobacteria bacterium]